MAIDAEVARALFDGQAEFKGKVVLKITIPGLVAGQRESLVSLPAPRDNLLLGGKSSDRCTHDGNKTHTARTTPVTGHER